MSERSKYRKMAKVTYSDYMYVCMYRRQYRPFVCYPFTRNWWEHCSRCYLFVYLSIHIAIKAKELEHHKEDRATKKEKREIIILKIKCIKTNPLECCVFCYAVLLHAFSLIPKLIHMTKQITVTPNWYSSISLLCVPSAQQHNMHEVDSIVLQFKLLVKWKKKKKNCTLLSI